MGRRIDDDEQTVLPLHELIDLRRIGSDVEMLLLIEKRIIRELAATLVTDDIIRTPEPVRGQYVGTTLRIVGDGMMDGARAACRRHSPAIPLGLVVGECQVDDRIEIVRQTGNRRVGDDVLHRQGTIDALHRRQAGKFPLVVNHRADGRVRNLLRAIFRHSLTAGSARAENRILESLVPCMRCSHTIRHLITPP